MVKDEYKTGLMLNEIIKRTVHYDRNQLINYLCTILCTELLRKSKDYTLLPEQHGALRLIIEDLKL